MHNLKERRVAAGFTQASLADAVGIDQQVLSAYEKGSRQPDPDTHRRLERALEDAVEHGIKTVSAKKPVPAGADTHPQGKPAGFIDLVDDQGLPVTVNAAHIVLVQPLDAEKVHWKVRTLIGDVYIRAPEADDLRQMLLER